MPSLRTTADRWRTDVFYIWNDTTKKFDQNNSFCAKMFRVDRFKSIYTRPVHRRQVTADPTVPIPSSYIVQQSSTGSVYMVSEIRRQDAINDVLYDGIMTLHLANSLSGGYASITRYAVAGTGDDLGPLVAATANSTYVDLELRTSSADPDAHDEFVGHYFATTPANSGIQKDDYIILAGEQYRIDEVYYDSGYRMARVAHEDYDKESLTYHLPQGSGGAYNPTTGSYTAETVADRVFSAVVAQNIERDMRDTPIGEEMLEVFVDFDHIGFTPEREHEITFNGEKYKIDSVTHASNKYQWKLVCRGLT